MVGVSELLSIFESTEDLGEAEDALDQIAAMERPEESFRRRPRRPRRDRPLAARQERAVLVRLESQVQALLLLPGKNICFAGIIGRGPAPRRR